MENQKKSGYQLYIDILRIIACFSVIMLHASAQPWYSLSVDGMGFKIANSYDALFRFGVPVFVMISGVLFLAPDREITVKKLYWHNILRLAVLYVFWSCLYGLMDCRGFDQAEIGWKDILREVILGRYHLWFLPMIIGIYVLLPVLKVWISHASKKNIEYFLLLFFVCQILGETIRAVHSSNMMDYVLNLFQPEMVCSYLGYFVLGYYLVYIGIDKKWHGIIYAGALGGGVLNILLGNFLAEKAGEPTGAIYDSFGMFTALISVALVIWVKDVFSEKKLKKKAEVAIRELSAATLGIYVMHVGLIEILEKHGINSQRVPLIFGIPLLAMGCFVICFIVSALLRRIPVVGKYIC